MAVNRISERALRKLMNERIPEDSLCVVKFYSNGCEYCTALHEYYTDISDEYEEEENVHFFAFNIGDVEDVKEIIKINGVPTIATVKTGLLKPRIRILEDPEPPNRKTWYYAKDIKDFVDKGR